MPVPVAIMGREGEYLMQAVKDDARRAGERDRLLLEAQRARITQSPCIISRPTMGHDHTVPGGGGTAKVAYGAPMKPPDFEFFRPASVTEALGLLGPEATVLAGGQSLVPLLSMRLAAPERVVDINRLAELDYVRVTDGQVRVGALARHARVLADQAARQAQPLLAKALRFVAHPAVRNRGTVVGSLVHADPAAEMPAVLAVLGGSVRLVSARGERVVPASEFFLGPLESAKEPDELAVEAIFPALPPQAGTGFAEISRRRGDYAICGVAVVAGPEQARAAYLAVGPVPLVADITEGPASIRPQTDLHATADYRHHLTGVLTERAMREATCMR